MMKSLILLFLVSLIAIGCAKKQKELTVSPQAPVTTFLEVPNETVDQSDLFYDKKSSLWSLDGQLYSGHVKAYYANGNLQKQFDVLAGKKQNIAHYFYRDGQTKMLMHYYKGKLHGEKKKWSEDSPQLLLAHLNYNSGKLHGVQKKWYPTGELFKVLDLNMGMEEGLQQAFRKNGELFANYEAKEGRIFGLKKAALCYGIEDDEIKR